MPARKAVTNKQLHMLINYMETDHSFAIDCTASSGNSSTTKHVVRQKWERLATKLNAVGGANKNGFKWRDYWSEKKCAVRKKAQQRLRQDTGKDPPKKNSTLSTTELRILSLVSNAAVKPNQSVRVPFDEPSADTPSPPAPISPTLPLVVQDASAGPSARQYVQAPATITSPEQMSPPLAADPQPQGTQELEDCLNAILELNIEAGEQIKTLIEQLEANTQVKISTTKSIETNMSQFSENTGFRANLIVAGIDRLIEAKERKLAPIEHIISTTEQLKADAEQLKAATEQYTAATERQIAKLKSMERPMLIFSENIRNAINRLIVSMDRLNAAQKRKIDPMKQNLLTITEQLIPATERLISANKPLERAMLHFQEIINIALSRVFAGLDRLENALPQVEESRRI